MKIKNLERAYFKGLILLVTVTLSANIFIIVYPGSGYEFFSFKGFYFSLVFAGVNFYLWKFLLQSWIESLAENNLSDQFFKNPWLKRIIKGMFLVLKLVIVLFTVLFVAKQASPFVFSFLLGFTAFLFVGMLFVLLDFKAMED